MVIYTASAFYHMSLFVCDLDILRRIASRCDLHHSSIELRQRRVTKTITPHRHRNAIPQLNSCIYQVSPNITPHHTTPGLISVLVFPPTQKGLRLPILVLLYGCLMFAQLRLFLLLNNSNYATLYVLFLKAAVMLNVTSA